MQMMAEGQQQAELVAGPFVVDESVIKEFQREYCRHPGGKYNLKVQVPYLVQLADAYFGKFKRTKHWKDALKAHALYNSVGYRRQHESVWEEKALEVQNEYFGDSVKIDLNHTHVSRLLTERLQRIRNHTHTQLNSADSPVKIALEQLQSAKDDQLEVKNRFFEEVQQVSIECTNGMIDLCNLVFKHSLGMLEESPPCSFSVVGIGSLAKGEATPYSDLEYIFLVEKENGNTWKYFEKLAMMSYFIIGNLRETPLDTMAIDELKWFDDKQRKGFRIDGLSVKAGNIPTGNGLTDQTNILTPEALLRRYKHVLSHPDTSEFVRGDLTAMLQYTTVLFTHGVAGASLLETFKKQCQACSISLQRQNSNKNLFIADAKHFNFQPNPELIERGYLVQAKEDLYRFPSILLTDASILTGFCDSSSWKTLGGLFGRGEISASIYHSIAFLLAATCYVRLAAYLFHSSQDDRLTVLDGRDELGVYEQPRHPAMVQAEKRWFLPQTLFVKHCEVSIPLKKHISRSTETEITDLLLMEIEEPTWLVQFEILHYCHKWLGAWNVFKEQMGRKVSVKNSEEILNKIRAEANGEMENLWFCVKALCYLLFQQREYQLASSFLTSLAIEVQELIDAEMDDHPIEQAKIASAKESDCHYLESLKLVYADLLEELGTSYVYLDQYAQGEAYYHQSLQIRSEFASKKPELVAKTQLQLGKCLWRMSKWNESIAILVESMQTFHSQASKRPIYDSCGREISQIDIACRLENANSPDSVLRDLNNSSVMLGRVLWNLGQVYFMQKFYRRAFNYFMAAKRMYDEGYGGNTCHKDISKCLLTLGVACDSLGDYAKADQYYRECSLMTVQLYQPERLSLVKRMEKKLRIGRNYYVYKTLVDTILQLPGYKVPHVESARVAQIFGVHLIYIEQHALAEWMLGTVAPNMYIETKRYKHNDIEIAKNISYMAINYWKQRRFELAIEHFLKALEMMQALDQEVTCLELAETHQNMGMLYLERKECVNARRQLVLAVDTYRKWCVSDHPKLLEAEEQLKHIDQFIDEHATSV